LLCPRLVPKLSSAHRQLQHRLPILPAAARPAATATETSFEHVLVLSGHKVDVQQLSANSEVSGNMHFFRQHRHKGAQKRIRQLPAKIFQQKATICMLDEKNNAGAGKAHHRSAYARGKMR
jgi:hypothetical protein